MSKPKVAKAEGKSTPLTAAAVAKYRPTGKRREIRDVGAPGLHLIIQPSGAKTWALRFRRPDGRPAKLTLGTCDDTGREGAAEPVLGGHLTLVGARRIASDVQRRRAAGQDVISDHLAERESRRTAVVEGAASTFGQTARDFLDQHKVRRSGQRPRRWREIACVLGLHYPATGGEPTAIRGGLAERWRDKPIASIDGHGIHAVVDEARRIGTPGTPPRNSGPSDARGRKMADALGALFRWAMQHRRKFMVANPCLGGFRPHPPAARDRVLNFRTDVRRGDEVQWFWSACDAAGEPFGAVLKLLLLTGCRLNEIARMTRDELSDDLATLRLPSERTKNGRPHDVPLPPLAREILAGVPRIEGCRYVFSTNGRTPVSGFSKVKARLDAEMPATIPPWRLHDLRRTAATGMAAIGIQPHIIEACLNHVSGAKGGVAGTYNREAYEPEKRAALQRWASHIEGIVSGRTGQVVPMHGGRA